MELRTERRPPPEGMDGQVPPESLHLERMARSMLDPVSRRGYEIVTPGFIESLESPPTGIGEGLELHGGGEEVARALADPGAPVGAVSPSGSSSTQGEGRG